MAVIIPFRRSNSFLPGIAAAIAFPRSGFSAINKIKISAPFGLLYHNAIYDAIWHSHIIQAQYFAKSHVSYIPTPKGMRFAALVVTKPHERRANNQLGCRTRNMQATKPLERRGNNQLGCWTRNMQATKTLERRENNQLGCCAS